MRAPHVNARDTPAMTDALDTPAEPLETASGHTREAAAFEARLCTWLKDEAGVHEWRRLVRLGDDEALVSKFEAGFSQRLFVLLDRVPELFDEATVVARYERMAAALPADTPRVDAWHATMHEACREAGERLGIPDIRLAEIRTGIDSVRAILEAVIWSGPAVRDDYTPRSGEVAAYREGLAALADDRDLFTRYYGTFEERAVRNHCPGAAFARKMLAQAWRACTGTPPPV